MVEERGLASFWGRWKGLRLEKPERGKWEGLSRVGEGGRKGEDRRGGAVKGHIEKEKVRKKKASRFSPFVEDEVL